MNEKKAVREVLALVAARFPELYAMHIKGRHKAFLGENAPESTYDGIGRKVGTLNKDLRLLWALARLLTKPYDDGLTIPDLSAARSVAAVSLQTIGDIAQYSLGCLCATLFWEFVETRWPVTRGVGLARGIRSDGSVFVVLLKKLSRDQVLGVQTLPEFLLHMIDMQAYVGNIARDATRRVAR